MTTFEIDFPARQAGPATPADLLKVLRQHWWTIAACIVLSVAAAAVYCVVAPKQYRSETMILVEDQKIPENFVKGVDEGNLEQRIFVIQKQVKSRAILTEIVKEFHLYPEIVAASGGMESAIAMLAGSISVEMLGKGPRGNFVGRTSLDAFTVSFVHEDPGTAMQVTARVVAKFIEQNLRMREQTAEGTTEFFDEEVVRAKADLERKENEISQFKATHMGKLPQQIEPNLRALDRLQSELNAGAETIRRTADRLALVDKAIQEYQRTGTTNPALVASGAEPDPLFRRLKEVREKLIKLKAEFWDTYPEVALTRDEMREIETKLVELYGPEVLRPGDKPLDPYLRDLKRQRSELTSELELLKQRQQLYRNDKMDYERRVERAPQVEQDLLILERDYENMKENYRALLDKRLNARVAENLEKRQKGAQFRILDTANFPRKPEKPNQPRIMIFGLLFGCATGIGLALLREYRSPQFRSAEDIEQVLGPHLLAVIPDFTLEHNRLRWLQLFSTPSARSLMSGEDANGEGQLMPLRSRHRNTSPGMRLDDNFIVKWMPHSFVAEQYRVGATRIALLESAGSSTVLAITSAVKGEGKTTTVINLGYTLARDLGKRTLLIDCDFMVPTLHRYMDAVLESGVADCLTSDVHWESCLADFGDVPCWIMPVGNSHIHANELLKTGRLQELLAQLRTRFDYILINTPPILPLATMNVLASHVDHLVLVVRANSTPHQVVKRAMKSLRSRTPVQVVLNRVGSGALPSYMYDYGYAESKAARP
jgi:polysaccharide chain length determinant protein (PEP-CTERM system associated)